MKIVYLAGPYTAPNEWGVRNNIERAMQVAAQIWAIPGLCCICPHGNTAHMGGAADYEKFMEGDLEIISRCDGVVMLPCWGASRGAVRELDRAMELGLPVFLWNEAVEAAKEIRKWVGSPTNAS